MMRRLRRITTIPLEFIRGIDTNAKDESIISVILGLADSLDLEVVAEGVETDRQLRLLKNKRCNHMQGYFFCRPMAAADIESSVFRSGHDANSGSDTAL